MQPDDKKQVFHNNNGYPHIEIGMREFVCCGATQPFDHPHIFLNMGNNASQICPYCATTFVFNHTLNKDETIPPGCVSFIIHKQ